MSEDKIIEINGVKFEVDARTATLRQVQHVQIGARVKVLKDDKVHHGVVVGFEPFKENPVVIICYIESSYWSMPELKFLYFSKSSKEQVIVSSERDEVGIEKEEVVRRLDKAITDKQREIQDLEERKKYFLNNFQAYWNPLEAVAA